MIYLLLGLVWVALTIFVSDGDAVTGLTCGLGFVVGILTNAIYTPLIPRGDK